MVQRFRSARRRRHRRSGQVVAVSGIGLLVGLLLLMRWADLRLHPVMVAAAQTAAERVAGNALESAVEKSMLTLGAYDQLMKEERDANGHVMEAHINFEQVQRLQQAALAEADEDLAALSQQTFRLPIGSLAGGLLFATGGPSLPLHVRLVGVVHGSIVPQSIALGLTQSVHILYLDLSVRMQVFTPFVQAPAVIRVKTPILWAVFGGQGPHTYIGPTSGQTKP